jgi:hypothetical protein
MYSYTKNISAFYQSKIDTGKFNNEIVALNLQSAVFLGISQDNATDIVFITFDAEPTLSEKDIIDLAVVNHRYIAPVPQIKNQDTVTPNRIKFKSTLWSTISAFPFFGTSVRGKPTKILIVASNSNPEQGICQVRLFNPATDTQICLWSNINNSLSIIYSMNTFNLPDTEQVIELQGKSQQNNYVIVDSLNIIYE